jgi:hypothetical protein
VEVQYLWTPRLYQVRLIGMSSSGKTDIFVFGIPQTSLQIEYCQGSCIRPSGLTGCVLNQVAFAVTWTDRSLELGDRSLQQRLGMQGLASVSTKHHHGPD